ncbi:hypothetical protein GCM10022222_22780 [Amycolatopsis ultiminotia]|uniref:Integrase catalytic domain-containing protein n=1 Tax=Amycolatopsis ultiminotia TaxID=543629 RepID=A0ABP6VN36_9PSEU
MQIDVTFVEPITTDTGGKKRFYQYTATDVPGLRAVPAAVPGREDPGRQRGRIPVGVPPAPTRPGHRACLHPTPRLNGKVERSHHIDADEFHRLLDGIVLGNIGTFNDKLKEREDYHNFHRPDGELGGHTPYERLLQKTQDGNDLRKHHT